MIVLRSLNCRSAFNVALETFSSLFSCVIAGAFADSTGATRAGAFDNRPASPAKLSATARAKHVEMLQLQERLAAATFYDDDNDSTSRNRPHPQPSPLNGGSFNSKTTNLPPVSAATLAAAAATGSATRMNPSSSSSLSLQRQSLAFGESSAEGAGLPTNSFAGTQFTGMTQYDLWGDGSGSDQEEVKDKQYISSAQELVFDISCLSFSLAIPLFFSRRTRT